LSGLRLRFDTEFTNLLIDITTKIFRQDSKKGTTIPTIKILVPATTSRIEYIVRTSLTNGGHAFLLNTKIFRQDSKEDTITFATDRSLYYFTKGAR